MKRTVPALLGLAALLSFPVTPRAAEGSLRLSWRPSPAEVAAWTAPGPPRPAPVVSLKVPLPREAAQLSACFEEEAWSPVEAAALEPPSGPPLSLGARGTFRGRPYAEILVRPVQRGGEGPPLLLTSARIHLRWEEEGEEPKGSQRQSFVAGASLFAAPAPLPAAPPPRRAPAEAAPAPPPPGLRIRIREDGLYRLSAADLAAAGFDLTGLSPDAIHLFCRGKELPLLVEGPAGVPFGSSHALLFFGERLRLPPRPLFNGGDFTDENVYWLRVDPGAPGLRMERANAAPASGYPLEASFTQRLRVERDDFFFNIYHYRPNGDLWYMGSPVYKNQPRTYTLPLHGLAGPPVTVTALVAALSSGAHTLSAALAGQPPASGPSPASFSGLGLFSFTWTFVSGASSGEVPLTLTVAGSGDYQIPDFFDVSYERTFAAHEGILDFTVPDRQARYAVTNLPAAPYLLDLTATDPETGLALPKLLENALFSGDTATFERPAEGGTERRLYAAAAPKSPAALEAAAPRDLASPSLGADLLILTHPDFHPEGETGAWGEYLRRRRGRFAVEVVDIQEVYDQFSDGLFDPTAIRAFLAAARSAWNPAPRYLLLVGDGTYDYKNAKADPTLKNWVPTMMFEDLTDFTYMGRYPSDAWFADVDGDGFPEVATGRLPVRSYGELEGLLAKIAAYEDQDRWGSWYRTGLFVADTWTASWEQQFETVNNGYRAAFFSPPWADLHLYFHDPPYNGTAADAFAAALRSAWPQSALVHYAGHSGVAFWGKNYAVFTAFPSRNCGGGTCADSDVDLLPPMTPGEAPLPFVLNSSCYNSAFDEVNTLALMEALVARPDRGAIGASGFTTIAYPDEEDAFNGAFLGEAFGWDKVRELGDLVDAGRFALPSTLARAVLGNVLLGDPTLRLRLPAPDPPSQLQAEGRDGAARLTWTPPAFGAAAFRVYLSEDGGATWAFSSQAGGSQTTVLVGGLENGREYLFTVTSVDGEGFEGHPADPASALPLPTPCTLSCTATAPAVASAGSEAVFSASYTEDHCGGTASFLWDFGDGGTSTDLSPRHTYAVPGSYAWSFTVEKDGASCQQSGSVTVVAPPQVTSVRTASGPFRLILQGGNFHSDARVYVGGVLWSNTTVKSASKIVLKGGATLKAALPAGVPVALRVVNGDGGETTVVFTR